MKIEIHMMKMQEIIQYLNIGIFTNLQNMDKFRDLTYFENNNLLNSISDSSNQVITTVFMAFLISDLTSSSTRWILLSKMLCMVSMLS